MAPQKPSTRIVSKDLIKAPSKKVAPNAIKARKVKTEKPCKQIFLGMTFSCSGNFGEGWEHDKMAMWVRKHGGVWQSEVSDGTSHLICTVEDYKKKTQQGMFLPVLERGLAFDTDHILYVQLEWLGLLALDATLLLEIGLKTAFHTRRRRSVPELRRAIHWIGC
jgi:hypothetical protein